MRITIRSLAVSSLLICASAPLLWAEAPTSKQMPLPKVDVYEVRPLSGIPVELQYPARLKSMRSATVVSRVTGVLQKKHYEEGTFIKRGSLLYTIEPDTYAATTHEREADLAVAEALFINAERDWKRVEALFNDDAISRKEYDASLAAYEQAKAQFGAATARLESARINLGYTRVKAPISGIAGKKQTDIGNVVSAGTPLVSITQTDPVYAEFSIPDVDLLKINQALGSGRWNKGNNDKLTVSIDIGGTVAKGTVDYISPIVNEKTASVEARAEFANADNALMPGSFGRIKITGLKRGTVTMVPQKAVLQNPKGTIVFIIEDGKAAVRPVKLGDTEGENYIVEGPLKPGDQVIVNNFFRVKPGMNVTIDKTINAQ